MEAVPVGVEDRVVPAVEVGDALPGLLAGQHVGAQRDHRTAAKARVPGAVVRGRVGEVGRSGADREARVPQGAVAALQRVGQQRLEALGGGVGRLGGIELEEHEAPGGLETADVEATGGQALAIAAAFPGQRVMDDPAAAASAQRVEGDEDGRQLAPAAQDDRHVRARSAVERGAPPPPAKLTRAGPRAGRACRPPRPGRRSAGPRSTPRARA